MMEKYLSALGDWEQDPKDEGKFDAAVEARIEYVLEQAGIEGQQAHACRVLAAAFGHGWATFPEDDENLPGIPGPRKEGRDVVHTTGGGSLRWTITSKGLVTLTSPNVEGVWVEVWLSIAKGRVASGHIPPQILGTTEPPGYQLPRVRDALQRAVSALCGFVEWERLRSINEY